jgi:hypothetical protein
VKAWKVIMEGNLAGLGEKGTPEFIGSVASAVVLVTIEDRREKGEELLPKCQQI